MIVIAGGGWAGCAAAYCAAAQGAGVMLIEKTDMLLGTGLVGGIMRNNGRYTALEELWAMGADGFIKLVESAVRHRWVNFPGHRHAMLYDVTNIEPVIRKALLDAGVKIKLETRITAVEKDGRKIKSLFSHGGIKYEGAVFIDTTGTAGPVKNCSKYGTGCAMCILRCPSFGPRVSITSLAGVEEFNAGINLPQFEAMSGSCKLDKKSLASWLVNNLERDGVLIIPLPADIQKENLLDKKACQQYNLKEYASNLILLDTGHAKLMTPYFSLEVLRTLPGFENARYADPYSGGKGNSIRFMAMAPCQETMAVKGIDNLFCAGEKAGPLVGHTEGMATGFLAGHNAVNIMNNSPPITLPRETACGDIISYMLQEISSPKGLEKKYTFSGSVYFERMLQLGLYTTDVGAIRKRVEDCGFTGVFLGLF